MNDKEKLTRQLRAFIREKEAQNLALRHFIQALHGTAEQTRPEEPEHTKIPLHKTNNPAAL